jgi:signal transduction histidine kinase
MPRPKSSWIHRLLRRLLAPGKGEVRAMEEAIHLASVLRYTVLYLATIVLPAGLLTYFGLASARSEEATAMGDARREATVVADTFWANVNRNFSSFEQRVGERLAAGRSPVEVPGELHPHLRVVMRFDEEGRMRAPFLEPEREEWVAEELLFHDVLRAADRSALSGEDPLVTARLYERAARELPSTTLRGRARYDQARMLLRAGQHREAMAILDEIQERWPVVRDPWGLRLGDLARLERAQALLERDREGGTRLVRALVDDLLDERWEVGQGGEAALAARALELLRPEDARDWLPSARSRVAERMKMLVWTEELLPDLDPIFGATPGRLPDGVLRWEAGSRALWATAWWGDEFYAFGFDLEGILSELKADARASAVADSDVAAWLADPSELAPTDALATKTLSPWLNGWSLVVSLRDPVALEATRSRQAAQRVGIVSMAVLLIGVGSMGSLWLIRRELGFARMQTDFAASVSHELRSPITHIRVQGEGLLYGLHDTEEEKTEAYLSIVRESERLSRLVDNVLDFAAIERGAKRYALRPGDIAESVIRAIESVSSAQEVQDKELDVDLPADLPTVYHDPDAVAQCVINLVSNAAKYSPPEGWIGVRGRMVEGGVEITISDKGIGIAPHDLRQIFEPFYRSRDALARRRKGTGIGLTITHYIMKAHGGGVLVQSRPGQGSTFTLRFPLRPPDGDGDT